MSLQAEQETMELRQALQEAREQLRTARDLAAERQVLLEEERAARVLAERVNALKDEFLAIVSHELRSPLSAIAGWAHILKCSSSPEDLERGVEVIEQSVRVQTKLIEDLLDISRMASGRLRLEVHPVEPRSFVDAAVEAIRPAAEAKGIRVRKVLDLAAGPVMGDPGRLQQVMLNLLTNAVKFTPDQGYVEVAVQRRGDHAEIVVADTGIGIPAAFLPHVFDRFCQADESIHSRYGGLGLGLAIVKHLVELHGGSIRAESPGEGCGATFVLRLPLHAWRSEAAARPAQGQAVPHSLPVAAESGVPAETAIHTGA
jgi:signal transduction histidine kinase